MSSILPLPGRSASRQGAADCSGDDQELGELLDVHRRAAFNLAYRLLGRPDDAADAVQDAFLRAVQAMRGDSAAPRNSQRFRSWLLRIVANVAVDQLRWRAKVTTEPLGDVERAMPAGDGGQPACELDRREDRGSILRALLSLPPTQRAALTLREYQGLSYDEIGTELGLTQAATATLLFRARASFRAAYAGVTATAAAVGCPELAPLLSALLDGELERDVWRRVDHHLRDCGRCRRELRHLRRSRRLYAAIPLLAPPAGWCDAAMAGAATAEATGMLAASAAAVPAVGLGTTSGLGGMLGVVGSFLGGKAAAVAVVAGVAVATTVTPAASEQPVVSTAQDVQTASAPRLSTSPMDFARPAFETIAFAPPAVEAVHASTSPPADLVARQAADVGIGNAVAVPAADAPVPPGLAQSSDARASGTPQAVVPGPADREDRSAAARANSSAASQVPGDPVASADATGQAKKAGGAGPPASDNPPGHEKAEKQPSGAGESDAEKPGAGQSGDHGSPEHTDDPPEEGQGPPSHANAAPNRPPPGQARAGPPVTPPRGRALAQGGPPGQSPSGPPGRSPDGPPGASPEGTLGEPTDSTAVEPGPGGPVAEPAGPPAASADVEPAVGPPGPSAASRPPAPTTEPLVQADASGQPKPRAGSPRPEPPQLPAQKSEAGQPKQSSKQSPGSSGSEKKSESVKTTSSNASKPSSSDDPKPPKKQ